MRPKQSITLGNGRDVPAVVAVPDLGPRTHAGTAVDLHGLDLPSSGLHDRQHLSSHAHRQPFCNPQRARSRNYTGVIFPAKDFAVHGAVLGIDIEVVKRSDALPGFVPVKKRWLVEQGVRHADVVTGAPSSPARPSPPP